MLHPPLCVAARLSPGEARTSKRPMIIEEQAEVDRQEMPAFRVYQKGPC